MPPAAPWPARGVIKSLHGSLVPAPAPGCLAAYSRPARQVALSRQSRSHLQHSSGPLQHACAAFPREDSSGDEVSAAFTRELQARQEASSSHALEAVEARGFDGRQLLAILQDKFGRSYDVCLVQRQVVGKMFIAFNIMWKYREQRSFGMTEQEYMDRLENAAAALRAWGAVKTVKDQVAAVKQRPRVGKAVSIILDVDEQTVRDWFAT